MWREIRAAQSTDLNCAANMSKTSKMQQPIPQKTPQLKRTHTVIGLLSLPRRSGKTQEEQQQQQQQSSFIFPRTISEGCQRLRLSADRKKKSLIQRVLPTQFSEEATEASLFQIHADPRLIRLNVYRVNDQIGFYHTGVVFCNVEYTFCQGKGICDHKPMEVDFATFLGSIKLGYSKVAEKRFGDTLQDMRDHGFSAADYDVMERSCNTFTKELSQRLQLLERYPSGVLNQSKLGQIFSPLARALDLLPDHDNNNNHHHQRKRSFIAPSCLLLKQVASAPSS